jgi:superfamily II helicase
VLQVYKDFVPLRLEQSKGARGIEIRLEEGVAIASIPSLTMENITQAVHTHFTQRISASSTLRKYEKLQKAMDLWATTQVVKATNLDGALSIALSEIANSVLKDEKVGWAFDVIGTANEELKKFEPRLDRRLLRILLIEACRKEFNAFGGVFP